MESSEKETIILINLADLEEGFFRISSKGMPAHTRRIKTRLDKLGVSYQLPEDGHYANFKIPKEALSVSILCIKSPSKARGISRKFGPLVAEARPPSK